MWTWLVLLLIPILFVMLSGFILKGDAESLQAGRILRSLLQSLPLVGETLAQAVLGQEENLQLIYVHHIATASILSVAVVYAHIRRLWASPRVLFLLLVLLLLLSLSITAPLHLPGKLALKGPWYFLGLQEALHWMARPAWSWLVAALFLGMLYLLRPASRRWARVLRAALLALGGVYLVLTLLGFFFRGEAWTWTPPWSEGQLDRINPYVLGPVSFRAGTSVNMDSLRPTALGRAESCLGCHRGMQGFSPAHEPGAIGCFSCHLGNPFAADKDRAHRGMLRVPGNLDHAQETCGRSGCHPEITLRVTRSIMATLNGMVHVNRFAFGEQDNPDGPAHVKDLGKGAADSHFRQLCASCHLGNPKAMPGPTDGISLGGGCNACHLSYSPGAERTFTAWQLSDSRGATWPRLHPRLTVDIPDERCFACHSRSGRISTSYAGWHETLMKAHEAHGVDSLRVLGDRRVFRFVASDVHHQAGMRCVDCHLSWELMGDGALYEHKEQQTRVRCGDCHFSGPPRRDGAPDTDLVRIGSLLGFDPSALPLLATGKGGYGMYHTRLMPDGRAVLLGKADGKPRLMRPPGPLCSEGTVHQRLDCATCHTAWAPTCIGCHNAYDAKLTSFDHLEGRFRQGGWEEYNGDFLADSPALGMMEEEGRIITVLPGMVMTVDTASWAGREGAPLFRRLFAPISAHTVQRRSLGCHECHLSANALGFGRGSLSLQGRGPEARWVFQARYASRDEDGLPEDAWTSFPGGKGGESTRRGLRPLSAEERRRMLRVGACLQCHEEGSAIMLSSLHDFPSLLGRLSPRCNDPGERGGLP